MRIIMGEHSYHGSLKIVGGHGSVRVGKYTSIADGFKAVTVGHDIENVSTFPFNSKHLRSEFPEAADIPGHPTHRGDIVIGSDCYIGVDVTILSGVNIGDGAVVAAGAVVTKCIKPYEVVGGVPAKYIKYRFGPLTITALLKIKWWDWPEDKIRENVNWLCSNDIGGFINKFGGDSWP
jgi:acetyltransferase-like isoleucine patch superfamily enzyme